MKIKFRPAPRPLFDPFDGLDADLLKQIEAKRAARCKTGKLDPKSGKCIVKRVKRGTP